MRLTASFTALICDLRPKIGKRHSEAMPYPNSAPSYSRRLGMLLVLAGLCLATIGESARAATIATGDVTAALGPTFFLDDATSGTPATPDAVYINGNSVTYSFPAVPRKFVRFKVTGP
jgi:hypothetical protein